MWVNIGIRVPECIERSFEPKKIKSYYSVAECNMRSVLGVMKNGDRQKETTYDLRGDLDEIMQDISHEIMQFVIPAFDVLSSREAILAHRREYPLYDRMNRHQILLEESMIYGRGNDIEKAKELFEAYCLQAKEWCRNPGHFSYLDDLARKLGIR